MVYIQNRIRKRLLETFDELSANFLRTFSVDDVELDGREGKSFNFSVSFPLSRHSVLLFFSLTN